MSLVYPKFRSQASFTAKLRMFSKSIALPIIRSGCPVSPDQSEICLTCLIRKDESDGLHLTISAIYIGCWECLRFRINSRRRFPRGNQGGIGSANATLLSNRGLTLYGHDEGFASILKRRSQRRKLAISGTQACLSDSLISREDR